jgi:hypothetical protein
VPTSKNDLKERLARFREIKISVIGRKSGEDDLDTRTFLSSFAHVMLISCLRHDTRGRQRGWGERFQWVRHGVQARFPRHERHAVDRGGA